MFVAQRFAASAARSGVRAASRSAPRSGASSESSGKWFVGSAAAATMATLGLGASSVVLASDCLHPPKYNWDHKGPFSSYDHAAIRRGHQVYTQICAACHSLERIAYRNLVGVCFTEEEVKNMAAEIDVQDGPDENGEMFDRPGKLSDYLPSPYENEEQGRMANAGAYPPDLSLMVKARHGGEDYLFALLTGYHDAPEGVNLRPGLYYNPYFPGGAIGMPKQLEDGGVEYEDGTPATASQMAKDVTVFLAWAAEPEADERKLMGLKALTGAVALGLLAGYWKRYRWGPIKSRKISFTN